MGGRSAVDTDFPAKLIDVYPPSAWYPQGYALNLTDRVARLRYRNGREQGELVKPGEPVPVTLTLYPHGCRPPYLPLASRSDVLLPVLWCRH